MIYVGSSLRELNELELSTVTREKVEKWSKFSIFPKDSKSPDKVRLVYALDYVCNYMNDLNESDLKEYMDSYNLGVDTKIDLNDKIGADNYTELSKDTILAYVICNGFFQYNRDTYIKASKKENIDYLIKYKYWSQDELDKVKNLPDKTFFISDWNHEYYMVTTKTESLAKKYVKAVILNMDKDDELGGDFDEENLEIRNIKSGTYKALDLEAYRLYDSWGPRHIKITVSNDGELELKW